MEIIHEYRDQDLTAEIYFSSTKALFTVVTCDGLRREFYTEQEAENFAEDFVLGEIKWHKQPHN